MSDMITKLKVILADTYALYLKTQNYHWHVKGPQFKTLHELFEMQYKQLALAVDEIGERILTAGDNAPATFREFEKLKSIKDGNSDLNANAMITELAEDHGKLIEALNAALRLAQDNRDEATAVLMGDRIVEHEKTQWMLNASRDIN